MKGGFKDLSEQDIYSPSTIRDYVSAQRDKIMSMQEKSLEQLAILDAVRKLERSGMALSNLIGLKSKLADNILTSVILSEEQMNRENFARKLAIAEAGAKARMGLGASIGMYDKAIYKTYRSPIGETLSGLSNALLGMGGTVAGRYAAGMSS